LCKSGENYALSIKHLRKTKSTVFCEKIFDKRLISRIYRELKKLNSLKINEPTKNWATELNRTFSKKEVQMATKHMKKWSPSLAIKEMQIKTH
jgi:hypothetical protein